MYRVNKKDTRTQFKSTNDFDNLKLHSKYLLKVIGRNTRKRREICSKLTTKTPERHSGVIIVNFEHTLHLLSSVSIVDFKHVFVCWVFSRIQSTS